MSGPHPSDTQAAADFDPQELARARHMWTSFTRNMKLGAIVIAAGGLVLAWITL